MSSATQAVQPTTDPPPIRSRILRPRAFPVMVYMTITAILFRFARDVSSPYLAVVAMGVPAQILAAFYADPVTFHLLVYIMSALVGWDVLTVLASRLARLAIDPSVYRPLMGTLAVVVLAMLGLVSPDMVLAGLYRAGAAAYSLLQQAGDGGGTLMAMRHRARLAPRRSAEERRQHTIAERRARYRQFYADT